MLDWLSDLLPLVAFMTFLMNIHKLHETRVDMASDNYCAVSQPCMCDRVWVIAWGWIGLFEFVSVPSNLQFGSEHGCFVDSCQSCIRWILIFIHLWTFVSKNYCENLLVLPFYFKFSMFLWNFFRYCILWLLLWLLYWTPLSTH